MGREFEAHRECDRHYALAVSNGMRTAMQRNESRRAGGVNACAGPLQSESKGNPSGGSRHVVARHGKYRSPSCRWLHHGPVRSLDTQEDAAVSTCESASLVACAMQRLVAVLEHESLLWIHHAHFGERDSKGRRIKALGFADETAVAYAGSLHRCQETGVDGVLQRPPPGRHMANCIAACTLQLRTC